MNSYDYTMMFGYVAGFGSALILVILVWGVLRVRERFLANDFDREE